MENYYSELYRDVPDKYVVVSRFGHSQIAVKTALLTDKISDLSEIWTDSFYNTYAVFDAPPEEGRGTNEDVSAIVAVFLDLDFGQAGKYADSKNPALSGGWIRPFILSVTTSGHRARPS
jgi:hypothetical protein